MTSKLDFGAALREIRIIRQLPQESLGPSQAFVSDLERGIRSPTLTKIEQLASLLEISPVTLLVYTYSRDEKSADELLSAVRKELGDLRK